MIRHWHPAKIAMLWVLDIALLGLLWEPCDTDYLLGFRMTRCFYTRNVLLWLVLSTPVFVITWKWASSREKLFSRGTIYNPNASQSVSSTSTIIEITAPSSSRLIKASPDLARAVVLQSRKDHRVLRIKHFDGTEMEVAVRYEMHPYHWERFGPCFWAVRHPKKPGSKWVGELIKYIDIDALCITDKKYALRLRLEDHYERITESKFCKTFGMIVIHTMLIGFVGGFAAMMLAGFVTDRLLVTSYETAFWWIAGIVAAFFLIWIFWRRSALLDPDGTLEGTPHVYLACIFGVLLGSIPLSLYSQICSSTTPLN